MKTIVLTIFLSLQTFASGTMETETSQRKSLNQTTKDQVLKLLKSNESLMMSFFEYDAKKIEKAAGDFKGKLDSIKDKVVMPEIEAAQKNLAKIAAKNKKEDNYEAYHEVSKALVKLIETYDLGSTYNVYYCPMVKKKWVQNSVKRRKVHNPYAPEMPHCGGQLTEY